MSESADAVTHKISSPALLASISEGTRLVMEIASLTTLWPFLDSDIQGNQHPVLVLPGFMGGDVSTTLCRAFLNKQGFDAQPWLLGMNTGREELQNDLLERFLLLREQYQQPISLVGHSLGGVFARELARRFPDDVRAVVTLGSPIATRDAKSVTRFVRILYQAVSGESVEQARASFGDPGAPVGVPCTAIFSRGDGVVHWSSCLERESDLTENIEVIGSHIGMVMNPSVLCVIADRLAQVDGKWHKFDYAKKGRAFCYPPAPGQFRVKTCTC